MNLEWLKSLTGIKCVIVSIAYDSLLNFHFVGICLDHCIWYWPVSGKGSLCILAWLLSISIPLSLFPISTFLIATFSNVLYKLRRTIYRNISNLAVTKMSTLFLNKSSFPGSHSLQLFARLFTAFHCMWYSNRQMIQCSINPQKSFNPLQQLSNLAANIIWRLFQKCLKAC